MNTKPPSQTSGDDVVSKRLIEKLRAIEASSMKLKEEYKRHRSKQRRALLHERWEVEKKRRYVERRLHALFRPKILERDSYKCRACGSSENLELVRLFGSLGGFAPIHAPEKMYSERNMFILCQECHKRFDSLCGRMWRIGSKAISSVEEAVELLRSKDLLEKPPFLMEHIKRYADEMMRRQALTLVNALRKIMVFQQQNDLKKARRHLGVARRELTFHRKRGVLTQTQYEQFMERLRLVREALDSGRRIDGVLDEVQRGIFEVVRTKVPPEVFCEIERAGSLTPTKRLENKNENAQNIRRPS